MTFLPLDQRELFLPLIDGVHESPPWHTFMRNLVARTHARRGLLIIGLANAMQGQEPAVLQVSAPRAADEPPLDFQRLISLRLHPHGQLRPDRVYGLEEMLDFDDPVRLAQQRKSLQELGIRYGRWLRISAGTADAWVVLAREREDFSAAAVASLSAIAPLFASALRARVKLAEQQLQAAMANSALARIGIGQLAFDRDGRIMAATAQAEAILPIADDPSGKPGRRLQLLPDISHRIDTACAAIADGNRDTAAIPLDGHGEQFLLLRRADLELPPPNALPAVIGMVRIHRLADARRAIDAIQTIYRLSAREAGLAYRMMRGERIIDAGASLRLTAETSRNYSKRIYAKTGTSGQADLVRLLLEGLAPLA